MSRPTTARSRSILLMLSNFFVDSSVLFEHGTTYALMGKRTMDIEDLEKILVDNPDYPEVEKKLTELKS